MKIGMRTLLIILAIAVAGVLLVPILAFGAVLLIPAALLVVLAVPLFGFACVMTLLAPDAERVGSGQAGTGQGRPHAESDIAHAGL